METKITPWIAVTTVCVLLVQVTSLPAAESEVSHDSAEPVYWTYYGDHGPAAWGRLYPGMCDSTMTRQSPIDIVPSTAKYNEHLSPITLLSPHSYIPDNSDSSEDGDAEPEPEPEDGVSHDQHGNHGAENVQYDNMILVNNGHTAVIKSINHVHIDGGELNGEFMVDSFHFHWGLTDDKGSEHTVDGKQYPIELHIVTYNIDEYVSLGEAVTGDNSLAVLGVFFEISEEDNPVLDPIISKLPEVQDYSTNNEVQIDGFDIAQLLPSNTDNYYRYLGSLTTPGCFESVVWTVFSTPQTISKRQLEQFRSLHENAHTEEVIHLVDNFRPTQALHSRVVQASFDPRPDSLEDGSSEQESVVGQSANSAPKCVISVLMAITTTLLCLVFSL